ncbi:hypothetical protein QAD02_009074 [Eretmocerus hayati]|uniref:Uncharacterized protein n=1 Tax=Eretmocerus hayati TaxID=131215 RepID=A0ACC2N930_9HYME|nr:hypothetical protein QAD02_009074 [Eretmocerus hayati]
MLDNRKVYTEKMKNDLDAKNNYLKDLPTKLEDVASTIASFESSLEHCQNIIEKFVEDTRTLISVSLESRINKEIRTGLYTIPKVNGVYTKGNFKVELLSSDIAPISGFSDITIKNWSYYRKKKQGQAPRVSSSNFDDIVSMLENESLKTKIQTKKKRSIAAMKLSKALNTYVEDTGNASKFS